MGWTKKTAPDASRYSVSVFTTNSTNSTLLGNRRGRSLATSIASKFATLVAIFMMVVAGFVGTISSSQPAQADMMSDMVDSICAGQGSTGYGAKDKTFMSPTTGDGSDGKATPYEKYGMSGTDWTVWVGFDPDTEGHIENDDYKGKGTSVGIINLIRNQGDDAKLSQWNDQFTKAGESNYPGFFNTTNECAALNPRAFPTIVGNIMLTVTKFVVWLSGYAYQAAADLSTSIYEMMEGPVETIVTTMKDKLYFAYLAPMIMVAALWMAYIGLVKKQATVALGGILWAAAAVVASVIFMTKPMLLPETMHKIVGGISQGGMAAITSYTHENGEGLCVVNPHNGDEESATTAVRAVQCNLWYSFVYTPWVMGQFGTSPAEISKAEDGHPNGLISRAEGDKSVVYDGNGLKLNVLKATDTDNSTGGPLSIQKVRIGDKAAPESEQIWPLYYLDHRSNHDDAVEQQKVNKTRAQVMVTANQLLDKDYNSDFRGDNGGNRVGVGLMAMVSAIGAGLMIVIISVSLIILDLGVIVLALVSPIFFLAALHPGAGRRIAMGWLETMVKLGLKRIALSIFLAIMVAIFGVMLSASVEDGMGWPMSMILIVALAAAGLTYQKQISEMFNGFSMGGQQFNRQSMPGEEAGKRYLRHKGYQAGHAAKEGTKNAAKATAGAIAGRITGAGAGPKPDSQSKLDKVEAARRAMAEKGQIPDGGAGDKPKNDGDDDGTNANNVGAGPNPDQPSLSDEERAAREAEAGAGERPDRDEELDENGNPILPVIGRDGDEDDSVAVEGGAGEAPRHIVGEDEDGNPIYSDAGAGPAVAAAAIGRREQRAEEKDQKAFNREKRNMINASTADGKTHVPTDAEVRASMAKKAAAAKARRDHKLRHITKVKRSLAPAGSVAKRGTAATGRGLTAVGSKTKSLGNQAFVEPSKEFSSMVREFKNQNLKPAAAAAATIPVVRKTLENRAERKDFKNVERKHLGEIQQERKDTIQQQKDMDRSIRNDIRTFKGNATQRKIYAEENYGRDVHGKVMLNAKGEEHPNAAKAADRYRQLRPETVTAAPVVVQSRTSETIHQRGSAPAPQTGSGRRANTPKPAIASGPSGSGQSPRRSVTPAPQATARPASAPTPSSPQQGRRVAASQSTPAPAGNTPLERMKQQNQAAPSKPALGSKQNPIEVVQPVIKENVVERQVVHEAPQAAPAPKNTSVPTASSRPSAPQSPAPKKQSAPLPPTAPKKETQSPDASTRSSARSFRQEHGTPMPESKPAARPAAPAAKQDKGKAPEIRVTEKVVGEKFHTENKTPLQIPSDSSAAKKFREEHNIPLPDANRPQSEPRGGTDTSAAAQFQKDNGIFDQRPKPPLTESTDKSKARSAAKRFLKDNPDLEK